MITNIFLVKHAHSIYGCDELNRPLSEEGINESKKVLDLLIDENITNIISSPYKRAIQTVEKIGDYFKVNIIINLEKEVFLTDMYMTSIKLFQNDGKISSLL